MIEFAEYLTIGGFTDDEKQEIVLMYARLYKATNNIEYGIKANTWLNELIESTDDSVEEIRRQNLIEK